MSIPIDKNVYSLEYHWTPCPVLTSRITIEFCVFATTGHWTAALPKYINYFYYKRDYEKDYANKSH
jgi:hypothetical protein